MDRSSFLKTCGLACLGAGAMLAFLESCGATRHVNGDIQGSDIVVPLTAFEYSKKQAVHHYPAIILQNELLKDTICVSRSADGSSYAAVLMVCTHQGAQLQLFGDKLQCPAHGSEFDLQGAVQQGPAEGRLRTFPVTVEAQQLRISLK